MTYTYTISESLQDYQGNLFKMIELKIIKDGVFVQRALPLCVRVVNGGNSVDSFWIVKSGNQKELICFFTVDAFTSFSTGSTIEFGYGSEYDQNITGVDVVAIPSLPVLTAGMPHQDANNAWLSGIIV